MPYYKVTEPEILKKIDAIFDERQKVLQQYQDFATLMCCTSFYASNTLLSGIELIGIGIKAELIDTVDLAKWRNTKTEKKGHIRLLPRKTNKAFYKQYQDNFPQDTFSYQPLLKLVLDEEYDPFTNPGFFLYYKRNKHFLVEAQNYQMSENMTEILHSEFQELSMSKSEQA